MLVASKDEALLDLMSEMNELEDEVKLITFMIENREKLRTERPVQGLVRFGIELDSDDKRDLKKLYPQLTEDFVILDEGDKPSRAMTVMLPIGLFLAWLFYWPAKKDEDEQPAGAQPPPMPSEGSQPPPLHGQ